LDDDDAFADYYFFLPVLREFGQTYGIADSDPITYAADYWFQRSDQYGGTITFNANGTEATYFIGERDYGNWTYMFTRTVGDATEFICTDDGP